MDPYGIIRKYEAGDTLSPIDHVVFNRRIEVEDPVSRVKTSESSFCRQSQAARRNTPDKTKLNV